jgi:hypothetical protein
MVDPVPSEPESPNASTCRQALRGHALFLLADAPAHLLGLVYGVVDDIAGSLSTFDGVEVVRRALHCLDAHSPSIGCIDQVLKLTWLAIEAVKVPGHDPLNLARANQVHHRFMGWSGPLASERGQVVVLEGVGYFPPLKVAQFATAFELCADLGPRLIAVLGSADVDSSAQ